jgi:nickel/cobalt exporter
MEPTLALFLAAASAGVIHTLLGPDHTVPLAALARNQRWSRRKTLGMTLGCGVIHLLSGLALAGAALVLGHSVEAWGLTEGVPGRLAGWLLVAFGVVYGVWGLREAYRPRRAAGPGRFSWVLFLVFVLGPCEPLIPLVMLPGALGNIAGTVVVVTTFAVATLATMAAVVGGAVAGLERLPRLRLAERFGGVAAGVLITGAGLAVTLGGL